MKREEFIARITDIVNNYIEYAVKSDNDPQIRINPLSLDMQFVGSRDRLADIAFSDEAVESAAAADDAASEDATDKQARQDPDFYAIDSLITESDGKAKANDRAIAAIADIYFK